MNLMLVLGKGRNKMIIEIKIGRVEYRVTYSNNVYFVARSGTRQQGPYQCFMDVMKWIIADVRDDYIKYRTETINNHDRIMGTIAQRLEDLTKLI